MAQRSVRHVESGVSEEAAFEFGVVYITIKNHLVTFAAKASNPYSFADAATRVARLLESEALRQSHGDSEMVPEVWADYPPNRRGRPSGSGKSLGWAAGALSDDAPRRRPLSAAARKRIAKAQKLRWAKFNAAKEAKGTLDTSDQDKLRARWRNAKKKSRAGISSKGVKNFWAKMTPAQRSAEMMRRRKVAAAKAKKEGRTAFMREAVEIAENRPSRANGAA